MKTIAFVVAAAVMLISAPVIAGHVGGPKSLTTSVEPGTTDFYELDFRQGEMIRVKVEGMGSSDLDCYLFDSQRNLVARDSDSTDLCIISTPALDTNYRLFVRNVGQRTNAYTVSTN